MYLYQRRNCGYNHGLFIVFVPEKAWNCGYNHGLFTRLLCQRRVGTVAIFMYCCLDSGKIFMYYGWACLEVPYWSLEQTTQNQTEQGGEPRPGWGQTATEMTHHRLNQPLYRMFCRYAINIINNADGVTVTASLPCVVIRTDITPAVHGCHGNFIFDYQEYHVHMTNFIWLQSWGVIFKQTS